MCGILGFISRQEKCSRETFTRGLNALESRGPDASGLFEHGPVLLGHRRLSIIDTSAEGNQPLHDASGRYTLIFNGEIFNFKELKKEKLSGIPINYRSHSDSEVLLYLLIHFGTDCLPWLSGFFAFAFYDSQTEETLLVRDRFGKKPLLVYQKNDTLIFGSELKALMPLIGTYELNKEAVFLYFQFNYLPPETGILQHLSKLPPGHLMRINRQGVQRECYYQTVIQPSAYSRYTYDEAKDQFKKLMFQSVSERMISDVPLGAFLSGGIDSSVVVAVASQFTDKLKTFSIGYKDNPLFDESKFAQLVADKYKTDHRVFMLNEADYKSEVFQILDYLDEPFADSSAIPQYILCRKTRAEVTVALSGDGGDEVFAGYNKHRAEWIFRHNRMLALIARAGNPLVRLLPQNKSTRLGNFARKLAKLADGAHLSDPMRYIRWCSILNPEEAGALFSQSFRENIRQQTLDGVYQQYSSSIRSDDFNEVLLSDIQLVLPGDMLHKVDMMSMANSLEVRSPFLDYRLVDFAFSLPFEYKIDRQMKKKIVQDTFRPDLPEALYNRPKQGFEIPLLQWFRQDFSDYIFGVLLEKKFIEQQGIFHYAEIERIKNKLYSNSPGNIQATVWALTVFQHWYKKYLMA